MADEIDTIDFWNHTGQNEWVEREYNYKPRTGDLLFFAGNKDSSALIRYFTDSNWSHVAWVIQNAIDNKFYTFEARSDTGKVTLTPLFERLDAYDGNIAVRQFRHAFTNEQLRKISRYVERKIHKPFNTNMRKWVNTMMDHWYYKSPVVRGFLYCNDGEESPDGGYLCSELVMEALRVAGVDENTSRPITTYVPEDMSESSTEMAFWVGDNSSFGPEIMIK